MIIKKYIGKTEIDAIEKAKGDLGSDAIVMNVKTVRPHGLMRIFLRSKVEVTAALEDNKSYSDERPKREAPTASTSDNNDRSSHGSKIDVSIPPLDKMPPLEKPSSNMTARTEADDEKQTNEERLSMLFSLLEKQMQEKSVTNNMNNSVRSQSTPTAKQVNIPIDREEKKQEPKKAEPEKKVEKPVTADAKKTEPDADEQEKDKASVYRDLIYKQLIQNEVDPSIAETIIEEAKSSLPKDAQVDQILGSVYQRIILMLGQPYTIDYKPNEPTKYVFFLGSTGVGKTTTIAKIASRLKLEQNCKLALVTADTYRVAAVEQLRVYADILSVPLNVVYNPEELSDMIDDLERYDVVLIDTAGCSHKNRDQIKDVKTLLEQIPISKRQVYLALSVGTKYKDLKEIAEVYSAITDYSIIFTKLDETSSAGVMLNMKVSTKCPLSYITNGQQVPDDIAKIDAQAVAKQLMS